MGQNGGTQAGSQARQLHAHVYTVMEPDHPPGTIFLADVAIVITIHDKAQVKVQSRALDRPDNTLKSCILDTSGKVGQQGL